MIETVKISRRNRANDVRWTFTLGGVVVGDTVTKNDGPVALERIALEISLIFGVYPNAVTVAGNRATVTR